MSIFSEIKFVAQDGEQGGNNFRLLMQACLTRPKAIASPPALGLLLQVSSLLFSIVKVTVRWQMFGWPVLT